MEKYPLLEQLRADRQRREDEITAPYREQIDGLAQLVRRLRDTLEQLQRALGSEIGKHMAAEIGHRISGNVQRAIFEAAAKARGPSDPVTFTLSLDDIRFSDPRSLESKILQRYQAETLPALSLRVDAMVNANDRVTVWDIRIPELGYRFQQAVH